MNLLRRCVRSGEHELGQPGLLHNPRIGVLHSFWRRFKKACPGQASPTWPGVPSIRVLLSARQLLLRHWSWMAVAQAEVPLLAKNDALKEWFST